jgi:hypothetical protein
MNARTLANKEYVQLAAKIQAGALDSPEQLKQVHRLLCEGRKVEDLTPAEQFYAAAFEGALLAQIPNDYGWEPGIEIEVEAEAEPKPPKPKKNGK